MKILEVINREKIINTLVEIWEDSVIHTHLFLTRQEIENIKKYVPIAINEVKHLIVIESIDNVIDGFMGINDEKIEMLFIKNSERNKGLGKELLKYGIAKYNANMVTVNEQNYNAKSFYEHFGFRTYKKSDIDEQGNPYPILYMKL